MILDVFQCSQLFLSLFPSLFFSHVLVTTSTFLPQTALILLLELAAVCDINFRNPVILCFFWRITLYESGRK